MTHKATMKIKVNGEWVDVSMLLGSFSDKVNMPKNGDTIDNGAAGQFAVSDGMGGIMWKTLVEVEEVGY